LVDKLLMSSKIGSFAQIWFNRKFMNIHSKEKDKKSRVYLFLIITALFVINGWLIFRLVKDQNEMTKQTEITEQLKAEQHELKTELSDLKLDVFDLEGRNQGLDSVINLRDAEIARKVAQINKMISGGNLSRSQLNKARSEINSLKGEIAQYQEQIKQLSEQNEVLAGEVKEQGETIEKQNEDYKKLEDSYNSEREKVAIASRLEAINLSFQAVRYRKIGGREKTVSKYSSMDKLKVTFALDNNVTAGKGVRNLYVKIFSPEKSTLHNEGKGSGSFKYKGDQSLFTLKEDFNFQNGNEEFTFYWEKMAAMGPGNYEVFLFCDDHIIGKQSLVLK
jgi:myosin heavy subunit